MCQPQFSALHTLTPLNDDSLLSILEDTWEDDEQIERQQDLGGKLHLSSVKYRLKEKSSEYKKIGKTLPPISDHTLFSLPRKSLKHNLGLILRDIV